MMKTLTTALRFFSLGCITLFAVAVYQHSQQGLVASVLLGFGALVLSAFTGLNDTQRREELLALVRPYLEPGETLQAVFPALSGWEAACFHHLLGGSVGIRTSFESANRLDAATIFWTIVATDRAFVLLKHKPGMVYAFEPTVATRVPRNIRLGPVSGRVAKIWLNGRWMFVVKRCFKDVELADRCS